MVVGGGNRAVQESLFLTRFCEKIFLVHRRDRLRADKVLQERLFSQPRIEVLWNSVLKKIEGGVSVEGVKIKNLNDESFYPLEVEGVFVFTGMIPNTQFVKDLIKLDEQGYIKTNLNMETSVPGIFAAGDVRDKTLRQVSTAVGDGATAAFLAEMYIEGLRNKKL